MTPSELAGDVLVVAGGVLLALAAVGSALPRDGLVRLHYVSLAAVVAAPLVLVGVVLRDPTDWFKLLLIAALVAVTSPVAGAATGRALVRSEAREQE